MTLNVAEITIVLATSGFINYAVAVCRLPYNIRGSSKIDVFELYMRQTYSILYLSSSRITNSIYATYGA